MRLYPFTRLLCLAAFSATALAVPLPPDAAEVDSAALLKSLEDMRQKQEETSSAQISRLVEQVAAASANPSAAMAFYQQAIAATQFEGLSQEKGEAREWKKREEARLKDSAFQESVRLHLYYLSLGLRRAGGAKIAELVPQLTAYLKQLGVAKDSLESRESLLKVSIDTSVFAKWLRLGPRLAKADKWEMNPGDANGIATKILLPFWREEKSPAVLDYWDAKIFAEAAGAGKTKLDFGVNDFMQVRKPALLWKKSQEYLVLGQRNRGISEMFSLIKAYPAHPEAADWIGTLEKVLKEPTPTPVVAQ